MPDISIDRTTYIKIGNSDPLTTGIAEGTMLIDRVLFAQDFLFGQFASSMFEIQIYGIDNVAGQKIEVYQKENDIRTDLFVGQIESSKLDHAGYYRDIIAYDKFYFISKKNVADWFNGLWTNNTEISVLDAYKSLLAHFDIDYDSNTVIATNFSGTLNKDSVVSFEKISFKDMVKYLLEPLGLIPYINESGKGAVFSPSMANAVDLSGKYDVNQSVFEEFTVKPMQWVGIQNIDSAILQQTEITGNTSDIRYDLPYNPIRLDLYVEDGETARTAVLTNFTNKANFTEYKPCEVFMIVSDMSIKLGDRITTARGTAYVSEIILSGPMLVEQQLISRGSQVQQEVEEEYDPVFAYLDNRITETADDLQQQLDDFEPSEEYLEKVGEFSDTIAGGMGLQVITYKAQDGSLLKYFYAPPPAGSAVTGISGSNFIFTMKSTGFAWTNKWEGAPDASSESHVDPGTGDTVSTQWTSGISANGNALLKILNAYKISADIITTGTLQSEDGDVSLDLDNKAINFGDKLTYDPVNGLNIDGTVTIGGSATIGDTITNKVEKAVDDLDIKGIDHETVEYQSGTSATTVPTGTWLSSPPSVSAGRYLWTRKITYYSDGTDNSNAPLYTVARQGSNGTSVSISSIQYGTSNSASTTPTNYSTTVPTSLTKGTWLWTKTTYSNNSTAITKTYIGTDGDDGDSVLVSNPVYDSITKTTTFTLTDKNGSKTVTLHDGQDGDEGEHVHFAWADNLEFSQDTPGSFDHSGFTTNNQYSTNKPYIGVCADSNTTDPQTPSSYSWTLVKGADGSDVESSVVEYAIGDSGTQAPTDSSSASKTETWYLTSSTTVSSLNNYKTPSAWKTAYNGGITPDIYYCIGGVYWDSRYKYLYSFDRTDYADGTYNLDNLQLIGTFGGSSTNVIEEKTFYGLSSNTDPSSTFNNASLWSSYYNKKQTGSASITAAYDRLTNAPWSSTNPYLYTLKRTTRANGTATISDLQLIGTYGSGSSSTVLAADKWYYASSSSTASAASTINSNWFGTQYENHGVHWQDTNWGWNGSSYSSSSNPYLYQLTRTIYQNGSSAISNVNLVATYGTSYPPIESDTSWQATPPDVAEHKGKYLWTRSTVTYSNGVDVVTYSVAYIAEDGASGTAGRGISSITQYYYASTSDQSSSLPAQMSGTSVNTAWKTLPSDLSNKFSETNKYLWTFVRTIYTESNGSTTGSNGSPYIVGTWGEKGDPGSGGSGTAGRGIVSVEKQYILKDQNGNPPATTISGELSLLFENAQSTTDYAVNNAKSFVPEVTGTYVFQSTGSVDTYGYLYNASKTEITHDDDSGDGNNFKISYTLTAGTLYYFGARRYSGSGGTINATLSWSISGSPADWSTEPPEYIAGYDYWERDVFTWTAAPITTYVPSENGVKSAGVSAAIRAVNELNSDYASLIIKSGNTTYIDGAKIFTGSVTASDIAAYNALIKNLMAHTVDVDGDITINSPALDTSGITVSQDDVAYELYGKSFSELTTLEQNFVLVSVVLRKIELAALEQSKLKVTDNTNWKTVIVPKGLYASNQGETKASHYGYDAEIYGDLVVHGTIYESGSTSFKNLTSSYNGAYCASGTINFSKKYTNVPEVQLTTQSSYPTFAVVEAVTTKDFTYRIYTTLNSTSATAALNYLVIP